MQKCISDHQGTECFVHLVVWSNVCFTLWRCQGLTVYQPNKDVDQHSLYNIVTSNFLESQDFLPDQELNLTTTTTRKLVKVLFFFTPITTKKVKKKSHCCKCYILQFCNKRRILCHHWSLVVVPFRSFGCHRTLYIFSSSILGAVTGSNGYQVGPDHKKTNLHNL